MAVVFAIVLARRFAQTHTNLEAAYAANLSLNQNLENLVVERTFQLQEKNKLITDSIEYAGQVQRSALPDISRMDTVFNGHFVLWRPRDVVGGDAYWFTDNGGDFVLGVFDCTGHGIPGALLAMASSSALDSLVHYTREGDPTVLLKDLDESLVRKLHQGRTEGMADDGLEIGLCRYDAGRRVLSFAGARHSLFVAEADGRVTELRGDRRGIGHSRNRSDAPFTLHQVEVTPDQRFYLVSDGFLDQNGGPEGFGLGRKRFVEVLETQRSVPMDHQGEFFSNFLEDWRGKEAQRDDITLVGFQVAADA